MVRGAPVTTVFNKIGQSIIQGTSTSTTAAAAGLGGDSSCVPTDACGSRVATRLTRTEGSGVQSPSGPGACGMAEHAAEEGEPQPSRQGTGASTDTSHSIQVTSRQPSHQEREGLPGAEPEARDSLTTAVDIAEELAALQAIKLLCPTCGVSSTNPLYDHCGKCREMICQYCATPGPFKTQLCFRCGPRFQPRLSSSIVQPLVARIASSEGGTSSAELQDGVDFIGATFRVRGQLNVEGEIEMSSDSESEDQEPNENAEGQDQEPNKMEKDKIKSLEKPMRLLKQKLLPQTKMMAEALP